MAWIHNCHGSGPEDMDPKMKSEILFNEKKVVENIALQHLQVNIFCCKTGYRMFDIHL